MPLKVVCLTKNPTVYQSPAIRNKAKDSSLLLQTTWKLQVYERLDVFAYPDAMCQPHDEKTTKPIEMKTPGGPVASREKMSIDKTTTALVVIDLQKGVVDIQTEPHQAKTVVTNAAKLAQAFRKNNMPVFLVRVTRTADGKDGLQPLTDNNTPTNLQRPADWAEIVPALGPEPGDFVITKRQWGAFYGTELDLQLRRRGIATIVLCGIATNLGVESTARFAFEYGYQQIFVEDACAARSAEEHHHTIKTTFARIGRIRKTDELLSALE